MVNVLGIVRIRKVENLIVNWSELFEFLLVSLKCAYLQKCASSLTTTSS